MFNLTKRQLVCFGSGAALGVPLFFLCKGFMGTSAAAIVLVVVMLPFMLMAMYEKNGQPLEKIVRNIANVALPHYDHQAPGGGCLSVYTAADLRVMQDWPLERKIKVTQAKIMEWYYHYGGNITVSFSGGKDSTVLLDLTRRAFPDVPAAFVDTGLEYPEIRAFVKSVSNVTWLRPEMPFNRVIEEYG